jgi:hypothetical protein
MEPPEETEFAVRQQLYPKGCPALLLSENGQSPVQKALQKAVEDQEIEESLEKLLKEGRFRTIYR